MNEWQTMDSPPVEELVILWLPRSQRVLLGSYEFDGGERLEGHVIVPDYWHWVDHDRGEAIDPDDQPTHWMPFCKPED